MISRTSLAAIGFALNLYAAVAFPQGSWTQKANFGGTARLGAVSFSIATKGFIGTGYSAQSNTVFSDFWEWNQTTNTWTQKANFGGGARGWAVGFSIGSRGFVGTGYDLIQTWSDFWEYDTT